MTQDQIHGAPCEEQIPKQWLTTPDVCRLIDRCEQMPEGKIDVSKH